MITQEGFQATWRYIDMFVNGLICTVSLSFFTVIFGFILALFLAIMRLSNWRPFKRLGMDKNGHLRGPGVATTLSKFNPLSFLTTCYVEVFRATPMLVQLFIIYYLVFSHISVPSFKLFGTIRFERFLPGVVALSLNSGAYLSEIIRSGIQSIDGGQTEAARSLGMTQTGTEHALHRAAAGDQEHPPRHRQRVRHDHQGILHLLHHRRAGDHVRRDEHQGRDLPHRRAADRGDAGVFLPHVPDQQDHRAF